jgi:hypothetical protein
VLGELGISEILHEGDKRGLGVFHENRWVFEAFEATGTSGCFDF